MAVSRWLRHLAALVLAAVTSSHADTVTEADFLVFVGQKIQVEQFEPPPCNDCIILDEHFRAHYRVLTTVYGAYKGADIRFVAFDHYGRPPFAEYEHVLLFVRRTKDGQWIHEKYQYFPVYETQDGGWAACGSANRFEHPSVRGPDTARPLAFKQPVVERIDKTLSTQELDVWYPRSDWDRTKGLATCRRGTPVAELFEGKRRGVLKARGLFE